MKQEFPRKVRLKSTYDAPLGVCRGMARLPKNSVVHLLPKSAQKMRPEHWFSTYIGARQVMVFWADLDGYYGCADAIGTRQAYILIDRSCKSHSRTRLLDTVIHEMTHVVELAYFQHTKVEFGWAQYDDGQ